MNSRVKILVYVFFCEIVCGLHVHATSSVQMYVNAIPCLGWSYTILVPCQIQVFCGFLSYVGRFSQKVPSKINTRIVK